MHPLLAVLALASAATAQYGSIPRNQPGQYGSIPRNQPGQLVPMGSCAHLVDCFGTYPLKPGHTRDEFPGRDPNPPRIVPGYVVPNYTIGPGDQNCPSGNCIPIDPSNICDAYSPDCLPGVNVKQPVLKCDPQHPRCPPNGFLVTPGVSCHPAGKVCPPGGVITTPQPCKPGEQCLCGCGTYLPPWVTKCKPDNLHCPNGVHVTDPPVWPVYPPNEPHIPGWPWNPNHKCDPNLGGHCDSDDIVVPTHPKDECDARKPGCIPQVNIPPTAPPCDSRDPSCPNGNCVLVPSQACHPNDPHPPPGCVAANPIPCPGGTEGCHNDVEIPPLVNPCRPGTPGCSDNGYHTPDRPITSPDDPVIPSNNPRLTLDPQGSQRCSFVETPHIPDGKITPDQCKSREEDLKPHFYGNSKFPCTRDDKSPALGPEVHGWIRIWLKGGDKEWNEMYSFNEDTILQVVNEGKADTRWNIKMDKKDIGSTDLGIFDLSLDCSHKKAQACVEANAPHGYFFIPAGFHYIDFLVGNTAGDKEKEHQVEFDFHYRFLKVAVCPPDTSKEGRPPANTEPPVPKNPGNVTPEPPSADPPRQENAPSPSPQPQDPPPQHESDPGSLPGTGTHNPPQVEPPADHAAPPQQDPGQQQPLATPQLQTPIYKDFPCTKDSSWPCRGAELHKWDNMWFKWTNEYPRPGPPAPWTTQINHQQDTILTLTDVENYVEHFEVFLDGKSIGETEEGPQHPFPDRWRAKCGHGEPERCMRDGWSHGFFKIPAGPHSLSISWTKGDFTGWVYATGMYRFDAVCSC